MIELICPLSTFVATLKSEEIRIEDQSLKTNEIRVEGVGREQICGRISYLLILILVSIVPKHSNELHIRTMWGRMGEI